jgi:uncharacterized membrane protein (UPF0127 family)
VKLKINKDSFDLDAKICSEWGKIRGLMFRKKEKARALIFNFPEEKRLAIHSLFVFFPFLAIWLDDKNEIISIKEVKPFCFSISPKKPFSTLIEIPINQKYAEEISSIKEKNPVDKKV